MAPLLHILLQTVSKSSETGEAVAPLFEAIENAAALGEVTIEMQRTPRQAARSATLVIRTAHLWIQAPAYMPNAGAIAVNVIQAAEERPPEGQKSTGCY